MARPIRVNTRRRAKLAALATGIYLSLNPFAHAGIVIIGDDLPPEPMVLDQSAKQELAYGEILFSFYGEHKFDAMTRLLAGQKTELFNTDSTQPELLLGNLYVELGVPDKAETIFDRLLQRDILSQLRAETWFQKASLDYRRGNYESAARILNSDRVKGLSPELDAHRHLMLANVRIGQEEFGEALASLYAIPTGTREGSYATYNMGVAMIRSKHTDEGVKLLNSVINLPEGEDEINALKDRAALAVGLTELGRKNLDASRNALVRIRVDGPFSNEALLALGLTNFERGEFKKALPLWLELVRRNPGHPSVQEALMLAPRAYEELRAMPQALAGYQFAAQTYRSELKRVELAIRDIDRKGWLDKLTGQKQSDHISVDPMAPVKDYTASEGPEMTYLYKLFASHDFAENFRQYNELQRLRAMLVNWLDEIPALQQAYANQQAHLQSVLPTVRNRLITLRRDQKTLMESSAVLASSIPNQLDMRQPQDLASFDQLQLWEVIEALQSGKNKSNAQYRERLRRVRGLLLYDIARDAPQNRAVQQQDASKVLEQAEVGAVRTDAVEQLVREATLHIRGNIGERIGGKRTQIEKMISNTDQLLDQLGQILKNDALRVLAQSRLQLGNQLGEAHLSMARLQDASVVQKIEQGAAQ
ncbi:MAG: tetratricopeptide repeat protein [Alcanivoracaceae bacterium]|nr:tetratricopeptide repeat protein [Alcanivoracaceae bacterium]